MNIGMTTNGELNYQRLTLLGDNGWRIPIAREFIHRGHKICWLGVKPHLCEDPELLQGIEDYYWIWRMRPGYPGYKASDYFAHILSTYEEKIGQYLPELDILFYEPKNFCIDQVAHQALLLHHYCQRPETVVMVMDADGVFMGDLAASFVSGADQHLRRLFNEIKDRIVLMYPSFELPPEWRQVYDVTVPMFVFYQQHKMFEPWPNPDPKYDVSYIGNDYDRRNMFERYFSRSLPISADERRVRKSFNRGKPDAEKRLYYDLGEPLPYTLELWGKWDEPYIRDQQFSSVNFHGPLDQTMVSMVYYNTLCCLNINRPIYSSTGFTVDRMSEVIQGGAVLLLNDDWYGGERVVTSKDFLIHDKKDLADKISWLRSLTTEQRKVILEKQLAVFKEFTEQKRIDMMLMYYEKYKGVLNKSPFNFADKRMDGIEWNVTPDQAKKISDDFYIKKAGMVDRKKARLKGQA